MTVYWGVSLAQLMLTTEIQIQSQNSRTSFKFITFVHCCLDFFLMDYEYKIHNIFPRFYKIYYRFNNYH